MTPILEDKPYVKYARDVLAGTIPACSYIKAACRRFIDDFSRDDIYFRYDIPDRLIAFSGLLKHFNSPDPNMNGQRIELSDWQTFCYANIWGWFRKDSNGRRYRMSYIEIPRKNAKTMLAAIQCVYAMISSQSAANQILLTANTREQAKICFEFVDKFCQQLDPRHKSLKVYRDRIKVKESGSFCLVMSSDYKTADGYSPYFSVIDEAHEMPSTAGLNVLRSGAVNKNSHISVITTSGFDINSPCYQLRKVAIDVVEGKKIDDSQFVAIWTLDPEDDWHMEQNWIKAAPNIGKSAPWEFYRNEYQAALNFPSQETNFLTKNMNMWLSVKSVWIPNHYINKVRGTVNLEEFYDRLTYMGVDLSSTGDITAICLSRYDSETDKYYFYNEYFLPERCLEEGANKDMYKEFAREGYLHIIPGNVIDYQDIINRLLSLREQYQFVIKKLGFDRWNAYQFIVDAQNAGLCSPSVAESVSQSIANFNIGTKEMERVIMQGRCVIDSNPVTAWMFENTTLKVDAIGNVRPNKAVTYGGGSEITTKKIDGVIAMIEALMMQMKYGHRIALYQDEMPERPA